MPDSVPELTSAPTPAVSLPSSTNMPFQARIRKPAYFDALLANGCERFGVYNRTYNALGFADPETEYWDLLNGVVLWPVAGERQLEITGPDAGRFVQFLTPRDLSSLRIGQCKYVLITADDGGIVNDPVCLRLAEDHYWLSAADSDLLLYARGINALAKMNVTLKDPDVSVLQVQGPKSQAVMERLVGERIAHMRYFDCIEAMILGAPVVVSRTGWSNEWGYEVYLRDPTSGDWVFNHILEQGRPEGIRLGVVS